MAASHLNFRLDANAAILTHFSNPAGRWPRCQTIALLDAGILTLVLQPGYFWPTENILLDIADGTVAYSRIYSCAIRQESAISRCWVASQKALILSHVVFAAGFLFYISAIMPAQNYANKKTDGQRHYQHACPYTVFAV